MPDTFEAIVGIDLGTTNSSVAALAGEKVKVLGPVDPALLPSVAGLTPDGKLLIGESARNQQLVYPERTASSIKRHMGTDFTVALGEKEYTPPEVSALILKELVAWASAELGVPVKKAVITVPAYFSDVQRQATREAGALAGLEVVRILNEPTAASFAYGYGLENAERHTILIYDLGGGTFDVSIVSIEGDITEVLASHGDNRLGGDDFDQLIVEWLVRNFEEQYGIEITHKEHPVAWSRLWWAAEDAKKKLSTDTWATIREEALVMDEGTPLHLEASLSRADYEEMIRPLIEGTLESVTTALSDAALKPSQIDSVLLVGGSTRTPFVWETLEKAMGKPPRQDVHPDLCVALGAGVLASRLAGHDVEKILVDVTPYSFGVSYLGLRGGYSYPHCYKPIIRRNSPLPITRTESYFTAYPLQTEVQVNIYQGDDPDALKNILVGEFLIDELRPVEEANELLCRMSLDIDGILNVGAIEKATGHSAHITIQGALTPKSEEEIEESRSRMEELFSRRGEDLEEMLAAIGALNPPSEEIVETDVMEADEDEGEEEESPGWIAKRERAERMLERSRSSLEKMHPDDREEAIGFHEDLEMALESKDAVALEEAISGLSELLFYVEGSR